MEGIILILILFLKDLILEFEISIDSNFGQTWIKWDTILL